MALTIVAVAALAYWDEERESDAAFDDFARKQATLAHGISVALSVRLAQPPPQPADVHAILKSLAALDSSHTRRLFLASPARPGLIGTDGRHVRNATIEQALAESKSSATLSRTEASRLGLEHRTAVAGIWLLPSQAAIAVGDDVASRRWAAVAVATAGTERDRELRAKWRLLLSVVLAAGLVLMFGGRALRQQRRELDLARELELSSLTRERDERLVRADKLAMLGALATGIAHEVSTPLGVIIGRAQQVLPKVADQERTQRAIQAIIDQAERINQVVRGMLALARGLTPTLAHMDPGQVARSACELVQHRFTQAEIQLQLALESALPQIACEQHLFEQVLVNLLLNACDASPARGHVVLRVHARAERVTFEVLDDGFGISPVDAARATEPFFTTKPQGQGTGLGLAIANEIIKHHQGNLSLGPRNAQAGTRAAVELPAVKNPA